MTNSWKMNNTLNEKIMIRKTAKYYREALKNNPSEELLKEIVIKYGAERDIYLADVECNWNHCIKGLCFAKGNRLCFRVYWQGDSTDGDVYVLVSDVRRGRAFVPAEHEVFDNRTYERHGDINVVREEYDNAIKALIDYLSPAAIKERKAEKLAYDALDIIDKKLRPEYFKTHYLDDRYWEARCETYDYVKEHAAEMRKLSRTDFRNSVAKIFKERAS